jgi:hypothetical protein
MEAADGGGGGQIDFWAETPVVGAVAGAAGVVAAGAAAAAVGAGAAAGWSGGTTQTKFSVSPDQAQNLINGLNDALSQLQDLYDQSLKLRTVGSPGKDFYSGSATLAVRKAAGEDAGGYGWANKQAQTALKNTIQNIKSALQSYQSVDHNNQQAFNSGGANQ